MKLKMILLIQVLLLVPVLQAQELVMADKRELTYSSPSSAGEIDPVKKTGEPKKYEYTKYDHSKSLNAIENETVGVHFFGNEVAKKDILFEQLFTYQVPVGPGSPATKTVIRKPAIYMAEQKLFKYYKKAVKSSKMDYDEACKEYSKVLDVCLSVVYQKSDEFEDSISETKQIENLAELFNTVTLISQE